MDKNEKYKHWEYKAIYDLETAEVMLNSGRYLYVAFMCQQAIEKLVKGVYVINKDEEPPRSHNILNVFDKAFNSMTKDEYFFIKSEEYSPFFEDLLAYYISERYPSYKEKLSIELDKKQALEILNKAKEVFLWLQYLKK